MDATSQGKPRALRHTAWLLLVALVALPLSACGGDKSGRDKDKDKDKVGVAGRKDFDGKDKDKARRSDRAKDGGASKDEGVCQSSEPHIQTVRRHQKALARETRREKNARSRKPY